MECSLGKSRVENNDKVKCKNNCHSNKVVGSIPTRRTGDSKLSVGVTVSVDGVGACVRACPCAGPVMNWRLVQG